MNFYPAKLNIKVTQATRDALGKYAALYGVPVSAISRQCLEVGLREMAEAHTARLNQVVQHLRDRVDESNMITVPRGTLEWEGQSIQAHRLVADSMREEALKLHDLQRVRDLDAIRKELDGIIQKRISGERHEMRDLFGLLSPVTR